MIPLTRFTRAFVLALALAGSAFAANSTDSTQTLSLTIAGNGACSALEVSNLPQKLSYTASLRTLSDSSCASSIQISKFYAQGACLTTRDNTLNFDSIKRLTCPEASDSSTSTCQNAFSKGPADSRLQLSSITLGSTFDQGNLCGANSRGYFYVQSNCTSSATVTVDFTQSDFNGVVCVDIGGYRLSTAAIVGIVIAIIVALVLLSWAFFCCCCGSCCCCC